MISIVDYGCGNIYAFVNAYKQLNIPVQVADTTKLIENAKKLILPGVGSYDYVMNNFNNSGLRKVIEKKVLQDKIKILGVCAGMQIFAENSEEGVQEGLGWISGKIRLFDCSKIKHKTKLQHME